MDDLKKLVNGIIQNSGQHTAPVINHQDVEDKFFDGAYIDVHNEEQPINIVPPSRQTIVRDEGHIIDTQEIKDESLSLSNNEIAFIKRALQKYNGKRKLAAQELGISERTLYRKIKEYNLE